MKIRIFLVVVCLIVINQKVASQCTNPPNGAGCKCSTAEVLCTPDELDGFMFTMSSSNNNGGVPNNDLCPGNNAEGMANNGNVPNNVNWFAFIAWCTDLTIEVSISNCTAGGGGSYGVQMALFADCGSPWNPIQCITESNEACGNSGNYPTSQTFVANGLTVGNTYYFMLDGCGGSACTVSLDVVGTCGTGTIDPWTQPISGPTETCVGSNNTYVAENLDGATDFHWYLNGSLLTQGTELTSISHVFNTEGSYQLCVDVSNDPCIPETDPPGQTCITIDVYDAEAGNLNATPNPTCPGETINLSVSNYNSGADYDEYLFLTNSSGTIIEVFNGDTGTFTYDQCGTFTLYSFNIAPSGAMPIPIVGNNVSTITCNNGCCELIQLPISFVDTQAPVFTNPPANQNYSCLDLLPPMEDLDYTDNCIPDGSVMGVQSGTATLCEGGTITRTWTISDLCNNTKTYSQTITIAPVTAPTFQNPPASMTIACTEIPNIMMENLTYTNNLAGSCLITASIPPTVSGTVDMCGGTLTKTWNDTDMCGHIINYQQVITVTPALAPQFVNPPSSMSLTCEQYQSFVPQDLSYTNNDNGACLISGTVPPTVSGSADICGGTITITWAFTDQCNRTINHTQTITVAPAPQPAYVNPPSDITVNCNNIPTTAPDLMLTNNITGACGINATVTATQIGSADMCGGNFMYRWEYTDACGRTIVHNQNITITPNPQAQFVNPPASTSVTCDNIPTSAPDLVVTNNGTGGCLIESTISPVMSGTANACGGTILFTWTFTDACNRVTSYVQTISVSAAPQGAFVNPPANVTVSCENAPTAPVNLTLTNGAMGVCAINATVIPSQTGSITICGGTINYTWQYTDMCNRVTTHTQTVTGQPAPIAVFDAPPADITVDCGSVPASGIPLNYSNGLTGTCGISGSVNSTRGGGISYCGGTLTDNWTYTDACGRIINASRNIVVNPAPPAVFDTPPADATISCENVPATNPSLNYTNGQSGICAINGSVTAIKTGNYNGCGGALVYTWTFTDNCNRTITASQNVTISPAPDPIFVDPPQDLTVNCGDTYTPPNTIPFSNGLNAPCGMMGSAFLTSTPNGNSITNVWEFAHPCTGEILSHTQVVTFSIGPDLVVNPIFVDLCEGQSFDLSTLDIQDLNNTNPVITFHTALPADASNEIDPVITPTVGGVYYVKALNALNCDDEEFVNVSVFVSPNAGDDNETTACSGGVPLNLFNYLSSDAELTGSWFDDDGTGINVSDPNSVSLFGISQGSYQLYYRVFGSDPCPDDEMVLTLNVIDEITFDILDVSCSADNSTYEITIFPNGYDIFTTTGDVIVIDENTVKVINIPISTEVIVTAIEPVSFCFADQTISPPNCGCPDVPVPTGIEFYRKCTNEVPFSMTVTVGNGLVANWYSTPSGTTPLASGTLSFSHTNNIAGTYSYYVEAYDPISMCKSNTRLKINVEIVNLPNSFDVIANECDDDGNGSSSFDLTAIASMINSNAANTIKFYVSNVDAQAGSNALASPYNNTSQDQILYVVTTNPAGCKKITTATLHLLPSPALSLAIEDESCLGKKDGTITASYGGLLPNPEYKLNNGNWVANPIFTNLSPANYTVSVRDTNGCISQKIDTVKTGLSIVIKSFSAICNNNGTVTDATDDYYTLTFLVENTVGLNGSFKLIGDNGYNQVFPYYTTSSFNIPAINQNIIFTIEDVANGCTAQRQIGPLTPCSTDCQVIVENLVGECKDNGTPSNPNDDYYLMSIKVSAINGSSTGTFNLFVDGTLKGAFMYNTDQSFNINADGNIKSIKIQDSEDVQCQTTMDYGPLTTCSDLCILDANMLIECANVNGSPETSDDVYTIHVFANLTNGGSSSSFIVKLDGTEYGRQSYGDTLDLSIISDGLSHTINVIDETNALCTDILTTPILNGCSEPCEVAFVIVSEDCFNPGNTPDPSDDYFEVTILPSISNSTSTKCNVKVDGTLTGMAAYGINFKITLPADGLAHTIEISDAQSSTCISNLNTSVLTPCSEPCELDVVVKEVICDNNGTNNTAADDTYSFIINVTGNGTIWEIVSLNLSGSYGQDVLIEKLPISQGDLNIRVRNKDNINCHKDLFISAPATCSVCVQTVDAGQGGELSCALSEIMLQASSSDLGTFKWTNSSGLVSNQLTAIASSPGYYVFTASYPDGCVAKDSVLITSDNSLPQVDAGQDLEISCNVQEVTLGGILTSEGNQIRYEWTDTNGNLVGSQKYLTVSEPGEYFLQVFNDQSNCKTGKEKVLVNDNRNDPSAIIYAAPTSIFNCIVESITLSGDDEPNVQNNWAFNGETFVQPALEIRTEGTYILIAIDTITGCKNQSSIIVTDLQEYPIIHLTVDEYLDCINKDVIVDATGTQVGPNISYQWIAPNGNVISTQQITQLQVNSPGDYMLVLKDENNGCINADTVTVQAFENEIKLDINPEIEIKKGQNIVLSVTTNIDASEIKAIIWDPNENLSCNNCLSPTVIGATAGVYTVQVEDIYGCKGIAQVRLIEKIDEIINIPNVINTNPNSSNNGFTVYGNEALLEILQMKIYDRWGNLLFTNSAIAPNEPQYGWDGRFNGKDVVQGVYVYLVEVLMASGEKRIITGDLTVLK